MNCPNCGTSNLDNASICVNCGRPLYAPPPPPPPPPPRMPSYTPPQAPVYGGETGPPPNYLLQAILVTFCCCLPFGIAAIIFAAQVSSKLAAGDLAGARAASANARKWCWIAFWTGIILNIVLFFFYGAAAFLQGFNEAWNR